MPSVAAVVAIEALAKPAKRQPQIKWNGVAANAYLRPHERMARYASSLFGLDAGDAMEAITSPNTKIHIGIKRRAMDMLFPKERPLPLRIPDVDSPEAYNAALKLIHEAWNTGQISPGEAESCQRLVNGRYRGWVKAQAAGRSG